MSYDNGVSFPKTKDHYHSTKCKTCIHCQLCAEFPRPWENKIDEPVNYYQEYAPQCVGCAYWDEWKTIEPEEHGSMEYKDRVEISRKLYNQLEPLGKLDRVKFIADVGKFKNMELLNLYWGDDNRMDNVVHLMIEIKCAQVDITVSNVQLDLQSPSMEREYWHTVSAGGDESSFPHKVMFQDHRWWQFKFTHYASDEDRVWGGFEYDHSVGPGHKGDALIDLMTWLYVNKDFIMEQANATLADAENKRVAAIKADEEREQHTLELLKGVI